MTAIANLNDPVILLKATGIIRTFGKGPTAVQALRGVELSIPQGTLTALRGRSGSGKTTLLNLLGALDRPTEGDIYFFEEHVSQMSEQERNHFRRTKIGLIFQTFALIPLMSVLENVEFGLRIAGTPSKQCRKLAEEALEFVGMHKRMSHRPFELSGGEQQRVAIARAIAHKPPLLLADEPTAELDSAMSLQVMRVFRDLTKKAGTTIIMTTHDPAMMEIVDHVFTLEDGKIVES
ncbi:putative ABC transporter ATP-binding protein [compost metagenome]